MYTLWRNDEMLGRIVLHPSTEQRDPSNVDIAGTLVPSPSFSIQSGVWQQQALMFPGSPVYQHAVADVVMDGEMPVDSDSGASERALRRMSDEEARGVPDEERFQIRIDSVAIDTESLMLQRIVIPESAHAAEIRRVNGLGEDVRELWQISAVYSLERLQREGQSYPDEAT